MVTGPRIFSGRCVTLTVCLLQPSQGVTSVFALSELGDRSKLSPKITSHLQSSGARTGKIALGSPKCAKFVLLLLGFLISDSAARGRVAAALPEPLGVPKIPEVCTQPAQSPLGWGVQADQDYCWYSHSRKKYDYLCSVSPFLFFVFAKVGSYSKHNGFRSFIIHFSNLSDCIPTGPDNEKLLMATALCIGKKEKCVQEPRRLHKETGNSQYPK